MYLFCKLTIKKKVTAKKKNKDLRKSICHTVALSNDLTMNPPQLKQNAPNNKSKYPGIL